MLLLQPEANSFWLQVCCYCNVFIRAMQGQANLSYLSVNELQLKPIVLVL